MRLDDLRESSNIEDRRGGFGRPVIWGGGGLGVVGLLLALLLGVNPGQLLSGDGSDSQAPATAPATAPGAGASDPLLHFSAKIVGSTEDVWRQIFAERGQAYQPPIFVPYTGETETGCGEGASAMGPFYCPNDRRVYIDLDFYRELRERFGAPGDFAQAYVIAHEVGHHVQNLLGEMNDDAAFAGAERGANGVSVRRELQADCYAGVWANRADKTEHILETGDVEQGLAAARAVGDDTLQRQTEGRVVPDAFTHGTSAQRVRWFERGLDQGTIEACDTFHARVL
ncbi:MAG: neutral zinc metallopeptidase [Caulobacteraceae bacterium]|nr:neutral zinc metallopeptidase [Caulobacteraceae bacterium]